MPYWLMHCWRSTSQKKRLDDPYTFLSNAVTWKIDPDNRRTEAKAPPGGLPELGDRVAVLRPGQRATVIGFGTVSRSEPVKTFLRNDHLCTIRPSEVLFDRPIIWSRVRVAREFRGFSTQSDSNKRGGRLPIPLDKGQWDVLQAALCDENSRPAPSWSRWELTVGDEISRTELHDRYGGSTVGAICPSGRNPHIFLFTGPERDIVWRTNRSDGSLVLRASGANIDGLVHHFREGRALRLFYRDRRSSSIVRYLGQYAVCSSDPIVDTSIESGHAHEFSAGGWALLRLVPVGKAELPRQGAHSMIGTPYRPESDSVKVCQAAPTAPDAALLTQANRIHRALQNDLANTLSEHGLVPRSPAVGEPRFDLAAPLGGRLLLVEVKSLTQDPRAQILKGFAQLCLYAEHFSQACHTVVPLLYVEQIPVEAIYRRMLERCGVLIADPRTIGDQLRDLIAKFNDDEPPTAGGMAIRKRLLARP